MTTVVAPDEDPEVPALILSVGETLIDFIVTDGAPRLESAHTYVARAGGAPANVAVALARLGVASAFAGVVGDDPFGRRLIESLSAERVDVSNVQHISHAATTLAFAWKDAHGDGHFWLLRAADTHLDQKLIDETNIQFRTALVVGSVALAVEPPRSAINRAVKVAVDHDVPVCFDVNVRPSLWPVHAEMRRACEPIIRQSTVIKCSLDDARHLFNREASAVEMISEMVSWSESRERPGLARRVIVLTDGDRGCWYTGGENARDIHHVPAFKVSSVEPTGAGDAFMAALLSRLVQRGWQMPDGDDIRYAAAAGALATTKPGAWEGLPTASELAAFLDTTPVS